MDQLSIAEIATRSGTYVLAVAIFFVTELIRRIVEGAVPSLKKQAHPNKPGLTYLNHWAVWWNGVVLYAVPVLLGCIAGWKLTADFLFGSLEVDARVMMGGAIGTCAGYLVKVAKKAIAQKTGVSFDAKTGDA